MRELLEIIPDADVFLGLEPEELGAKILFALKTHGESTFHPTNIRLEIWEPRPGYNPDRMYPRERRYDIDLAFTEAWAWLEAQGLVLPKPGEERGGWCLLSRRARKFENEEEFTKYAVARMLPKNALHPKIATSVWTAFMRGEFDVAVFQAMKAVEVAVREAAGFSDADYGTDMIARAFNEDKGPLRDPTSLPAERTALRNLL